MLLRCVLVVIKSRSRVDKSPIQPSVNEGFFLPGYAVKPRVWTAPQKLDTQLIKVQFFMAKPKYSLETRLAVVNHYLAGHDGA
ncbi:hypothetical protein, partial [Salmonella enterica]|uniref:hypothetical protein n=1 Tax=Salmonella enterica TaxID=28901 RepID=UPI001C45A504